MRTFGAVILVLMAAACSSGPSVAQSGIDAGVIQAAESRLEPVCDRPLRAYNRYYALARSDGRDVIVARYVVRPFVSWRRSRSTPIAGVRGAFVTTAAHLPTCSEEDMWRGCDIVHFMLDPRTGDVVPLEPAPESRMVDGVLVESLALTMICSSIT